MTKLPNDCIFPGLNNINIPSIHRWINFVYKSFKLGFLRKEIPPKPLNMQSFGHQTFISSQPYLPT